MCCCGCSLETGSVIIGILQLIVSLFGAVIFSLALVFRDVLETYVCEHHPQIDCQQFKTSLDSTLTPIIGVAVAYYILFAIISSMLIHGSIKKKPSLLTAWLIFMGIDIVAIVILVCVMTGLYLVWTYLLVEVGFAILRIYFMMVVHSYKKSLMRSDTFEKLY